MLAGESAPLPARASRHKWIRQSTAATDTVEVVVVSDEPVEDDHAQQVKEMYELHRAVGRKAMTKALAVLDALDVDAIPVNVAVQLLKFGAELERRAVLGIEPGVGEDDPFDALVAAMADVPVADSRLSVPALVRPRWCSQPSTLPTRGTMDAQVAGMLGWSLFNWQQEGADLAGEYHPVTGGHGSARSGSALPGREARPRWSWCGSHVNCSRPDRPWRTPRRTRSPA